MGNGSLITPLRENGLTTLTISINYQKDIVTLSAGREWDEHVNWKDYSRTFSYETNLTEERRFLSTTDTLELYKKYDCDEFLRRVIELMKEDRHEAIECLYLHSKDIFFMNFAHTSRKGIHNQFHAIRSGGIRRHDRDKDELSVIIDGLNLSRAMSYKNVAAQIPFGGSKLIVYSDPIALDDYDALGFLAYAIDRSRSFTGPDMGLTPEHAGVIRERFSRNITGDDKSALGPTAGPTAEGVFASLREVADFKWGSPNLAGKTVAVQGLGAVGSRLAKLLLEAGAHTIVSEVNQDSLEKFLSEHQGKPITVVDPDEIIFSDADIFAPCAMGGVITEEIIPKLKFEIIFGPANNQLSAISTEEEIRLAQMLDKAGILFQVDWVHNGAGVIAGFEDWLHQERASIERVREATVKVCTEGTVKNLRESKAKGITPTENVYLKTRSEIFW